MTRRQWVVTGVLVAVAVGFGVKSASQETFDSGLDATEQPNTATRVANEIGAVATPEPGSTPNNGAVPTTLTPMTPPTSDLNAQRSQIQYPSLAPNTAPYQTNSALGQSPNLAQPVQPGIDTSLGSGLSTDLGSGLSTAPYGASGQGLSTLPPVNGDMNGGTTSGTTSGTTTAPAGP